MSSSGKKKTKPASKGRAKKQSARSVRPAPSPAKSESAQPELVIITGLSGSGKATALKAFEDFGFYCVDNLPLGLIPKFAELTKEHPSVRSAALVVDIREGGSLKEFPKLYRELRKRIRIRLLFLEADDEVIMRRFSETRRPHPLREAISVTESVRAERERLHQIRDLADTIINTSKLNVHELRDLVYEKFYGQRDASAMLIYVTSFGFRYGVPEDSDLIFDVRFLPTPNFIPEYKPHTGLHPKVAAFIASFPQTNEFLTRISDMLIYLIPHYVREGKSYLTIAFGCTGGHHRSVMMAHEIRKRLEGEGYRVKETHRDVNKT